MKSSVPDDIEHTYVVLLVSLRYFLGRIPDCNSIYGFLQSSEDHILDTMYKVLSRIIAAMGIPGMSLSYVKLSCKI